MFLGIEGPWYMTGVTGFHFCFDITTLPILQKPVASQPTSTVATSTVYE